jgi:hypothetical protein
MVSVKLLVILPFFIRVSGMKQQQQQHLDLDHLQPSLNSATGESNQSCQSVKIMQNLSLT